MEHPRPDHLLAGFSGEFVSDAMERSFQESTWNDYKPVVRKTLLVMSFMAIAFFVRDIFEATAGTKIYLLLYLRLAVVAIIIGSAEYIHRAETYFPRYPHLLLFNQVLVAAGISILAVVREMPFSYVGVNTILLTLMYYQFLTNRFRFTVAASALLAVSALVISGVFLDMNVSGFLASILFLIPVNFLGIIILRSINRTRRQEYLALKELRDSNDEREKLIQELQTALDEVKTLRGFIPICANCHKIRTDEGFWERLETYIQSRTGARFSHGICRECAEKLYPNYKGKREGSSSGNPDRVSGS